LREEHRLRVLESRVLRAIFAVRGRKWKETGGNYILRGCMIGTACQVLLGCSYKEEMGSACGMCGEEVKCIQGFGGENLKRAVARPRHM